MISRTPPLRVTTHCTCAGGAIGVALLVEAIQRNVGLVFAHAHAKEITSGRPGHVTLQDGHTIVADEIVVATNAPIHSRLAMHAKQAARRTLVIGVNVPRGSVRAALYYDTLKPHHYARVHRALRSGSKDDLLIVGGEDHPTGAIDDATKRWKALERWARERFPMSREVAYRWSGQVFEPHDGLAYIGRDRGAAHLSIVTGASGSGMTYGMIATIMLTDSWNGRKNPWAELYDPGRKVPKSKRESGGAANEPDVEDDAEEAKPRSVVSIRRGEGAIVRRSGHPYAVYRDEQGSLIRKQRNARISVARCPGTPRRRPGTARVMDHASIATEESSRRRQSTISSRRPPAGRGSELPRRRWAKWPSQGRANSSRPADLPKTSRTPHRDRKDASRTKIRGRGCALHAPSDSISLPTRHTPSRRGWPTYALLVGLCLSAVAVGLCASWRQTLLRDEMSRRHRIWSERLARYGRMRELTLAISAPSNEVFDSGDLDAESARSRRARVAFTAQMDSARLDLGRLRPGASSSLIHDDLVVVEQAAGAMIVDVNRTFASFDVGPAPEVAIIDGHLARIGEALDQLERHAREGQELESRELLASSASFQRFATAILVLILMLTIAIGLIARRASLRAASVEPELEPESESEPNALPLIAGGGGGGHAAPHRWLGYALPVGLCLCTVAVSLHASHRQTLMRSEVLDLHRTWSERVARYGRMGRLAIAMSAPCNEVFDSGDLPAELARSRQARAAFVAEMDSARLELSSLRRGVSSAKILEGLADVEKATGAMMIDVNRTFASYGVGRPPDLLVIDGHLARIDEALDQLGGRAREAQRLEAGAALSASTSFQRLASTVLALIPVLVIVIALIFRHRSRRTATTTPQEPEQTPAPPLLSEAPARLTLDAGPDPVVTIDADGRVTAWNGHAETTFGLSFDAMRGSRFSETVIAPRHREALDQIMRRFLDDGDEGDLNRRLEVTALDQEGKEFPIELAIVPTRDGGTTLFSVFVRDITERKRADDQLRRLALVASKTANGVLITDALGRAEWINEAFARISGHSLEEVRGKTPDAIFRSPLTESAAIRRMVDGVRSGTEFHVELASEAAEGSPRWVEIEASPIFDDGGTLSQFIAIVTDVSERKRVVAALRESEARTLAIVEEAVDAIIAVDELGAITKVNPACERIFGYRPGELVGKHVRTLMPCHTNGNGDHAPASERGPWPVTGDHDPVGRRRNGSVFPIELSIREAQVDGHRSWTGIVRDVTQRKQAEALRVGQNRVLELLASGAPLAGALTELIHIVEAQQPGTVCMILTLDHEARLCVGASLSLPEDLARALDGAEIGRSACTWGAAAYLKKRVIVDDTATHPLWAGFRELALYHGLRSSWAEPILSASGHTLGVFAAFRRRVHTPDASELELVASAARLASIAIERARATEAHQAYGRAVEEAVSRAA